MTPSREAPRPRPAAPGSPSTGGGKSGAVQARTHAAVAGRGRQVRRRRRRPLQHDRPRGVALLAADEVDAPASLEAEVRRRVDDLGLQRLGRERVELRERALGAERRGDVERPLARRQPEGHGGSTGRTAIVTDSSGSTRTVSFQPSSPGSGGRASPSRRARCRTCTSNPSNVTLCETVPSCVIRQIWVPSPELRRRRLLRHRQVLGGRVDGGVRHRRRGRRWPRAGASTPSVAVLRPYSGSKRSLTILPCTGSVSR